MLLAAFAINSTHKKGLADTLKQAKGIMTLID